jgi:hypothetical protein
MRKVPITLSLPEAMVKDLHTYISRRHISAFVAEVIGQSLDAQKRMLADEYRQAAEESMEEFKLWDQVMGDGIE